MEETSRAQNKALLAKVQEITGNMQENARAQNEMLLAKMDAKFEDISKATNEKLAEISGAFNKKVEGIENEMFSLRKGVVEKFTNIDTKINEIDGKFTGIDIKINEIEERVNNVQFQAGPVRVVPEATSRIKPPCFDGSIPLSVFKLQFETVASRNGWSNQEMALELILALKGTAAQILETVPASSRNNYEELMMALQRKYGNEHKRDLYRMELRGKMQKVNESLQAFAMEIERLVQLVYPEENNQMVDHIKTEAFVNGIRDPEIKLAVCCTQKTSFAETVAFALAQETARAVSKPQISRVRGMEVVQENEDNSGEIKDLMKQLLSEMRQRNNNRCFNCGKSGHFQRNCKAPRKRARSVSPARNNKRPSNQLQSRESPLN